MTLKKIFPPTNEGMKLLYDARDIAKEELTRTRSPKNDKCPLVEKRSSGNETTVKSFQRIRLDDSRRSLRSAFADRFSGATSFPFFSAAISVRKWTTGISA